MATVATARARFARIATTALAVVGVATTLAVAPAALPGQHAASAQARTALPRTPAGLPRAIEGFAGYSGQVSCDTRIRPGTKRLATLLANTYRSAHSSWSSTYSCGTDGDRSEHYDGRAIDWMVGIRSPKQYVAAKAALTWLLGKDKAGNTAAMARRLGVMYIIFNNKMWGSWSNRWEPYNGCAKLKSRGYDSSCHRNHIHISLSWDGAMARTSFWTKRVRTTVDYGVCRWQGMNWAPRYFHARTTPCAGYPTYKAKKGSSATKKSLVKYSGLTVRSGTTGPAVIAVQKALHVSATGTYNTATRRAIQSFQGRHHVTRSGNVYVTTWRPLLAATR